MFIRTAAAILHRGPEPRDQPPLDTGSPPPPDTRAPLWTPQSTAERASLATTLAGRGRGSASWAPPTPWQNLQKSSSRHRRGVFISDSPFPRPQALLLTGPLRLHSSLGALKNSPPLDLSDWGKALRPHPPESAPLPGWSRLTRSGLHLLFPIGDRILNSASCSFPVFHWFYMDNRAPFALLVLAKSYRKQATLPVSHWWNLPTPPSYDDVIFALASDPWMAGG